MISARSEFTPVNSYVNSISDMVEVDSEQCTPAIWNWHHWCAIV